MGAAESAQIDDPNKQSSQKLPKSKEKTHLKNSKSVDMSNPKSSVKKQSVYIKQKATSSKAVKTDKQKEVKSSSTKLPPISKNNKRYSSQEQQEQTNQSFPPLCLNKNKSSMICLWSKCNKYPFYCFQCEKNCEQLHHHSSKVVSTSCSQFYSKVLSQKRRANNLKYTTKRYRKCLANLQRVVTKYIEKQLARLQKVERQLQIPAIVNKTQNMIQKNRYLDIKGSELSQLWKYYGLSFQEQIANKIKIIQSKQRNTQKISQCFANINTLCSTKSQSPASNSKVKNTKTIHRFRKYGTNNDVLDKQRSWSSNIQQ